MKNIVIPILLILLFVTAPSAWAVDVAPHISDREIVERLTQMKEALETQKDEMTFLNELIKWLLPTGRVL